MALSRIFPYARIITIEPSQENFNLLSNNVASNPKIEPVFGALVGGGEKKITLLDPGTGEWGFTAVQIPNNNPETKKLHETPAFRLSDLVDDVSEVGLIKIDIEGAERDLIEKDAATLDLIPNIFIELHDRIVPGCVSAFMEFSKSRIIVKSGGEKYLSITRKL